MTSTVLAGLDQHAGLSRPVHAIAAPHCGFRAAAVEHHEVPAVVFDEPSALQGTRGNQFDQGLTPAARLGARLCRAMAPISVLSQ